MRVLFAITKSELGGAQTHVWQLASHLWRTGHSVHITATPGGWLHEVAAQAGIPFHANSALSNSFNPVTGLRAARQLVALLDAIRPDIVHCHSSAAGFWGRLGIRAATPTVFTAHGWGFTAGAPAARRLALLACERSVARFTSRFICVSEFDRRAALKYRVAPPEKIVAIHNGIEEQERVERPLDREKLRIVFVGRLSRQKDPEMLVRAVAELPTRIREALEVQIVGEGPLLPTLRQLVRELAQDIQLSGAVPREEVMHILAGAHIFVLTSHYEGFPLSILEAMSMGLAIIASDVGGVSEAVTTECGILIPRGDKEALKLALTRLAEDRGAIERFGAAARERARREFSIVKMCEKTMAVYESVRAR